MADNDSTQHDGAADGDEYEPPEIEVLGSVAELTRGPSAGAGDFPTGVISF